MVKDDDLTWLRYDYCHDSRAIFHDYTISMDSHDYGPDNRVKIVNSDRS